MFKKIVLLTIIFIMAIGQYAGAADLGLSADLTKYGIYGGNIRVDGDSFGLYRYLNETREGNLFPERVARLKKFTLTNSSVNGSEANDVWHRINTGVSVPSQYNHHMINVGYNDVRHWGNLPSTNLDVKNKIVNIAAFLRLGSITDSADTAIMYTGTWASVLPVRPNDFYGTDARYTTTINDRANYYFMGNSVTIGLLGRSNTAGATVEIKVDGVVKQTINTANQCNSNSVYVNIAVELTNLGAGAHTLTITKTDASGSTLYIDWIGIPSLDPPIIIVNGITKMITANYALNAPYNNGSDALMLAANKSIREGLSMFDERVIFIDQSDFDPNNYNVISKDGSHPNDYGHEWIASNILKRL